jgi:hypothetical protein
MEQHNGEFIVGWGTLTLINAGLAQSKGRSGLNWFLLSLFLGPVATFLIVVSDPIAASQPVTEPDQSSDRPGAEIYSADIYSDERNSPPASP